MVPSVAVVLALALASCSSALAGPTESVSGRNITRMMSGAKAVTMLAPAQVSKLALAYKFASPGQLLDRLNHDRDLHISPSLHLAYRCPPVTSKPNARRSLLEEEGEEEHEHEHHEHGHSHGHAVAHFHSHGGGGALPAVDPELIPKRSLLQLAVDNNIQDPGLIGLKSAGSGLPLLHSRPS